MADEAVEQIRDFETGRWEVATASGSRYIVDLDERTLTRCQAGMDNQLRKDASAVRIIGMIECKVGASAEFVLGGISADPDAVTTRQTSPVTAIVKADRPAV